MNRTKHLITRCAVSFAVLGVDSRVCSATSPQATQPPRSSPHVVSVDSNPDVRVLSQSFREAAIAVEPSVVSICATRWTQRYEGSASTATSRFYDPLKRFFGAEFLDQFFGQRAAVQGYEQRTLGTGVLMNSEGYLLTNEFLVAGANEVVVRFSSGKEYEAEVVGHDRRTDLALLKIAGAAEPSVRLA